MDSILIVEDEAHLAEGLRFNLEAEGFNVAVAQTGEAALDYLASHSPSALLLDVMLPGCDGFQVASELRKRDNFVPILMLTARGRAEDVLKGFEAGADDYLPKPFDLSILIARLRGLLRRSRWSRKDEKPVSVDEFTFDGKTIDFSKLELIAEGKVVNLTLMEVQLMRYLTSHEGEVVSRKSILNDVWQLDESTDTRAIDNFIVRLRKHIEVDPAQPRHLLTVRGVGYRFVAHPQE